MQSEVGNMQGDWRSSPSLNVISVIVSVIGLLISSFSNISTPIKLIVIVAGLIACIYVALGGKSRSNTFTSAAQKPAGVTPTPSPAPPASLQNNQASPIPERGYSQTPPSYQPAQVGSQPETAEPSAPPPIAGVGAASSSLSWKERFGMLLAAIVMFGIPGVLLFRSSVGWQHIVGIILLVFAVLGGIGAAFPEASDRLDQLTNKTDQIIDKMN
jgi:hypothetical protein